MADGLLVQLAVRVDVRANVRDFVAVLEAGGDGVDGRVGVAALCGGRAVGTVDGGRLGVGHAREGERVGGKGS